jgi:hypothetical protein
LPLPAGEYRIFAGWYRWDTGERLTTTLDGQPVPDNRVPLGSVTLP